MTPEVLFIGGRSGVGKSSVAFDVHERLARAQVRHFHLEGDFLDMAHPPAPGRIERHLAALWRSYLADSHHRMIYVNAVSVLSNEAPLAVLGRHRPSPPRRP